MSFQKDSRTGTIEFSYTRTQLFHNASLRSTYKARNLTDQQGRFIGEPYALSDDERDAFDVCVGNAVSGVYDTVQKLTAGGTDAFTADANRVAFSIRDNRGYSESILKSLDIDVQNALITGILREWYDLCAKPDFFAEQAAKYQVAITQLHDRLFQLKKKTLD